MAAVTDQTNGDTIKKFIHVDRVSYLLKESLSIRRRADYRSEANFTLVGTISYVPRIGQDVVIKYDSATVFGGIIKSIERGLAAENNTTVLYDVYCNGYNDIPAKRTVSGTHDATDAGTIVEYYVDNYLYQEGISKGTINTGATITEYDAVCKSIKDILDDMAMASGFKWYINYSKVLYFLQDDTPAAAAHVLDTDSFTDFRNVKFNETLEQYRNKQFISGGIGDDGYLISVNDTYAAEVTNRQNIEGNSGYYGDVLWDSTIDNSTDADTAADNLLKKYGKELPSRITFDTGQLDFVPGTKLTVNLTALDITTSYFLIEEVEIYDLNGVILRSRISAVLRNNADFSSQKTDEYVEYFSHLVKAAKEGGNPVVNMMTDTDGNLYQVKLYVQPGEPTAANAKSLWIDTDDFSRVDRTAVTSDVTLTSSGNEYIEGTSTAIVTMFTSSGNTGVLRMFKNISTGLLAVESTENIDGSTSKILYPYESMAVLSNGSGWSVL